MKYLISIALGLFLLFPLSAGAQDKPAYRLFDKNGKRKTYRKLLKKARQADIILFGEYHNNPIAHWLQLELTKDLGDRSKLVLGFEMLERDNQDAVNRYLNGEINQKGLDTLARLWNNYKTDYKPLVDYAKDKHFPVIATNIPRRYASMVFRGGFQALDSLGRNEYEWIARLPIDYDPELPSYKAMTEMEHANHMPADMKENMPKAQAIKDATMAESILDNLPEKGIFIHYNGAYHSDDFEGIGWYLKKANPGLKILTISTVSTGNVKKFLDDAREKADFIIQVDEDMTTTYP